MSSIRKKYRKMRIKFDEKMRESNTFCVEMQLAEETIRRLAIENESVLPPIMNSELTRSCSRLLDLLLDVNESAQIPAEKRIDLTNGTPALEAVPPLISTDELARAAEFNTPAGQVIYNEIRSIIDEKAAEKSMAKPPKSLAWLMATTPHLTRDSSLVSPDLVASLMPLDDQKEPIAYLTADAMDYYLYEVDAALGTVPPPPPHTHSPAQDLALKNPHSVYHWLRRNEPKIFLQDGEGSEKSMGKPGSLRGAGKRASMPGPSKPDALEIVEEDGLGYDPTIGGLEPVKGGKRKRDDDGGYHPKSGTPGEGKTRKPRPKKKKVEGETPAPSSSRKKAKTKASSPMAVDPATPSEGA